MRRRPTSLLIAVIGLGAGACEDPAPPVREQGYALEDPRNGLTFRWTRDFLPVRYWVAGDAGVVTTFVQAGVRTWSAAFLYGEYRGQLVADSAQAHVLVFVEPRVPPAGNPNDDPPLLGACSGRTAYDLEVDEDRLRLPFRITVTWYSGFESTDVVNCLERVTIHEIGHTLGLFGHSPNEQDLMHANPRVRQPSPGDRATVEILYHTVPTIAPPEVP